MIDSTTGKPLLVGCIETPWPYIDVAVSQLDEVRQLLTANGIRHWVSENYVSMNDGPFVAEINLGRGVDATAVQEILDRAGGDH